MVIFFSKIEYYLYRTKELNLSSAILCNDITACFYRDSRNETVRTAPLNRGGTLEDRDRYEYIDASQTQQQSAAKASSTSNNSTPSQRKKNGY